MMRMGVITPKARPMPWRCYRRLQLKSWCEAKEQSGEVLNLSTLVYVRHVRSREMHTTLSCRYMAGRMPGERTAAEG